jgi:DNA-binding CsgD family transcriptional regulator|tara:strand:- start:102 stop:1823 length:1722 start_codon:yes stop_codon:yes gene_type:complete
LFLTLLFSLSSLWPTDARGVQEHKSLNDSIQEYKQIAPNKAIDFAFDAINLVDHDNPTIDLVSTYSLLGEILNMQGSEANALSYYGLALKTFEVVPPSQRIEKNIDKPAWLLLNIGNLYFQTDEKDLNKAEEYYRESEKNFLLYKSEKNKKKGLNTVYDNLALIALSNKDFVLAEQYYLKTLKSREELNIPEDIMYSFNDLIGLNLSKNDLTKANYYRIKLTDLYEKQNKKNGIDLTTNIQRNYGYSFYDYGFYYFSKKEYEKSIEYLKIAKEALIKFPMEHPPINSKLAKCYLMLNNLSMAEKIAIENLQIKNIRNNDKKENYKILEKIYATRNSSNDLLRIKDSLIQLAGFSYSNSVLKEFKNLETQILLSKNQSQLNQNRIRYNTYLFILIIGSTILFFTLISIRVNYNYQKEKNLRLEKEQQIISKELEKKEVELVSKTNFIAQRNQYLNVLKDSIIKEEKNKTSAELISKNIKNDINRIIGSQKVFEDFENHFTKVYPEFLKELIKRYGQLSQTDLRLCAYIKMNQTKSEIALITGASSRTIESQRYRLSKKLNLTKQEDLSSLIISI